MPEERLQKILSQAGVTSRRKAEELIQAGRVSVNGEILTELGSKADIDRDHIKVDGKQVNAHHPARATLQRHLHPAAGRAAEVDDAGGGVKRDTGHQVERRAEAFVGEAEILGGVPLHGAIPWSAGA